MEIYSSESENNYVRITPPKEKPPLLIWCGIVMTNWMDQVSLNKDKELEMAKILHEFITSNAHMFSESVLAAAKVLLEEIRKAENV